MTVNIINNSTNKTKKSKQVNSEYLQNEIGSLYSVLGLNSQAPQSISQLNDANDKKTKAQAQQENHNSGEGK